MTGATGMLTRGQRQDAKDAILLMLWKTSTGHSQLGQDGGITNLEMAEVLSYMFYGGTTTPAYTYELLRVLLSNKLVERQRVLGRPSQWRITRAGVAHLLALEDAA